MDTFEIERAELDRMMRVADGLYRRVVNAHKQEMATLFFAAVGVLRSGEVGAREILSAMLDVRDQHFGGVMPEPFRKEATMRDIRRLAKACGVPAVRVNPPPPPRDMCSSAYLKPFPRWNGNGGGGGPEAKNGIVPRSDVWSRNPSKKSFYASTGRR